jgi:hypothetical protein
LEAYLDGSDGHALILSLGSSSIVVSQNHDWVYVSKTNIGLQSSFALTLHFGNKVLAYLLFNCETFYLQVSQGQDSLPCGNQVQVFSIST